MKVELKFDASLWRKLHSKARKAVTHKRQKKFKRFIKYLIQNSPCDQCKLHLGEFLQKNPLKKYCHIKDSNTGLNVGYFRWSWLLHNDVNSRLGKQIINLYKAYAIYYPDVPIFHPQPIIY